MASNDEQRSATTIFTTAAQSIAARLIANKTTAKFTKAEISTTNLFNQSVTELQVLTSLDNVQQTADINTVTVINDSTVDVNIAIDQTKAPNDYQMNSVGLFAVDGDGKEVLYSVTVLKDPVYIHQDAMGSALGIDLETVVGQSSNVDLSINPAGAVTNEALKVTLADYVKTDDVEKLIPATVIDGSKPADFKEPVTLEKGAVDGAGNAIATAKDVSDGDAKTLTSAKEYADVQASDKVKDADTAGGRNLIAQSNSVAGYMVSEGTLYADVLTSGERTSDFISVDIAKPYSLGVRVTLPANTQFWYAFSLFDKNKKFIKRMAATGPMSTDGSIDEERYWLLAPGDTRKSPLYNFTEDTAYVRVSWRSYDNAKVSFSRGLYPEDYVPAPEDKVSVSDTASWQKAKITGDDGSPKSFLYAKDNGNITMWIAGRPLGMHTFWCAAGVAGNPVSSSIQGTMSISSVKNGVGYCVSADDDFISITLVDGQVNYDILTKKSDIDPSVIVKTTLTASDDVLNLDYGSYTISGPLPKNAPDLENTGINWGTLVVHKTLSGANKTLEYRDVKGNVLINILSGKPLTWSGWHIPNENSVVKDNGDDTVSINGKSYVPANAANVVHRNPDTGSVSESVDFTNAKANGHPIIPIETSTDKDTAQTNSTTTPNVIYLY
ncbi:hypothetical protein [Levilactobacillus brevis]|uniref:hypothetical protein n=1 Tax=Levilactobacillus brevis TaxID=1580 RepID=UPI003F4C0032